MNFRGLGQGLGSLRGLGRAVLRGPARHDGVSGGISGGASGACQSQFGAIPYRHVDGEIVFLIITSRGTGKWIFPKGGLIEGLSPAESAAQEAYEEAGVRGNIGAQPVGSYRTLKTRSGVETLVPVQMYPLVVAEQLDDWPEKSERRRHWVTLGEARRLLSEPDLVVLAEKVAGGVSG
jgi:8-oxo-dGTP pyrophosphatase MutT (NUDIX family)